MKKALALLLTLTFLFAFCTISANAANSGSLSAGGTARAGETFTVTFTAYGAVGSYSGTFNYDSSQVTLQGVSNGGGSHWANFSSSGNTVFAQRDSGTTDSVSFTATFKVNQGVATGTNINIGFSGTIATDVNTENSFSVSASRTVEAPPSNDCTLASLSVSNVPMTPAFSPNTLTYSCGKVKFDVARLNISAAANAQGADVSVSGADLRVGKNTVYIKVTAPSGATKTYTITCEREQDPNYKASNNTKITSIEISYGDFSPAFKTDQKEYVVYVPYEIEKFSVKCAAADPLAQGVENVEDQALKIGINELVVKVTAEDGTVGEYTFYVVRMDEFGGKDTVGLPASLIGVEPEAEPEPEPEAKEAEPVKDGVPWWLLAVVGVAALGVGFGSAAMIFRMRKYEEPPYEDDSIDDVVQKPADPIDEYLNDAFDDYDEP